MLTGPERIEISDDQLNQLKTVYKELTEDVASLMNDFFIPFEIMQSEGIFTGTSAEAFTSFCKLVNDYLEARFQMSLEELQEAAANFEEKINEVESYTG